MREGFLVQWPEPVDGGVGVGGGLEVGQELVAVFVPAAHADNALVDLPQNAGRGQPTAGAEAAFVAEGAAACRDRAVHIWARKSRVDADFLDAPAKLLSQEMV